MASHVIPLAYVSVALEGEGVFVGRTIREARARDVRQTADDDRHEKGELDKGVVDEERLLPA